VGNDDAQREGDLAPGTTVGQYQVLRRIGAGGMAEVYEATHEGLNKRVAIKTLRRQYAENETIVARFLREGQVASRIRHPNIVDVTDVGVIDGLPCLVMEYLEGESLHALFKRRGAMPIDELVDLILPVLAAVGVAHEHSVVHRDLKPANVFVTRGWNGETQTKVLDFGISKVVCEPTPSALTTDSTFLGSPHYVAPELARGERVIDGRCDQYSIGVILYEGSSGVRPFAHRTETFMSLMYAIAQGDFPPLRAHLPDVCREFEAIVERAMSLQPSQRYASLQAMGRALLPLGGARARLLWAPTFFAGRAALPPPAIGAEPVSPQVLEESQGTLGQSASEIDKTPRIVRRRRGPIGWVAAGGLTLLVGSTVWLGVRRWQRRSAPGVEALSQPALPAPAQRTAAVPTPPPAPKSFEADTRVHPPSALIQLDGQRAGIGTFAHTFDMDGTEHVLRISAPGYETLELAFRDAPPPADVELIPRPEPQRTRAAPHAAAKAPNHASNDFHTDNRDPWAN
jgi:tRNA A-37 threonylcarbamoyl transferase component Bud32